MTHDDAYKTVLEAVNEATDAPFVRLPRNTVRALLDGYTAAVKRGEWKTVELPDEEDGTHFMMEFYVCSNCGKKVFFHSQKTPFCPQCGADMRGPEPGREVGQ